ncbi:Uncharacterised protein [Mycobacteroides abscessus]|nr:Uncharacterised protein [Mycobacteroides abscessus]
MRPRVRAAAASGCCPGLFDDLRQTALSLYPGIGDGAFCDVVASADDGLGGQVFGTRGCLWLSGTEQQAHSVGGDKALAVEQLTEHPSVCGAAQGDGADQPVVADHNFFVPATRGVGQRQHFQLRI